LICVSDGRWKSAAGAGGNGASPSRNSRIALGVERRARNQLAKNGLNSSFAPLWVRLARTESWHPTVAATNNLMTDLLPTREVPCAWPAPALAGWYCYLGVLVLIAYRRFQSTGPPISCGPVAGLVVRFVSKNAPLPWIWPSS
jgi:hypothetical protein